MSILPLEHGTWCVLRKLLRDGPIVHGKQLRVDKSRKTKSGEFLDALVRRGLIYVFSVGGDAWSRGYALTAAGYQAAESGEALWVGPVATGMYVFSEELPDPSDLAMAGALMAVKGVAVGVFGRSVSPAVEARAQLIVEAFKEAREAVANGRLVAARGKGAPGGK